MSSSRAVRRRRLRRPQLENLEHRYVFSGDSALWDEALPWSEAGSLTMSFAPDGTAIGQHSSSLFATLGAANPTTWQTAIEAAFQTWAESVNVNVGLVADDGSAFGTAAPSHGDLRFGDVRFGAVPMSSDELAVAIPHNRPMAGSWSGDILFNSTIDYSSTDKVFEVALHELGHVLGLGHSDDPLSPMFPTYGDQLLLPTSADLANLADRYGVRLPDAHEGAAGNDSLATATPIKYADEVEQGQPAYDGSTPLVVYGEVAGTTDPDVFKLKVPKGYTGPITVTFRTSSFSLLAPQLTVLSTSGQTLATTTASEGGDATVTLPGGSTSNYYVRLEAATGATNLVGAYALVVTFDQRLSVAAEDIERVVRTGRQLVSFDEGEVDEADMRRMFTSPQTLPVLDEDGHQDDDEQGAVDLEPVVSSASVVDFRTIATLSDATDVDNYHVESHPLSQSGQNLLITLQAIDVEGLIPKATLFDENDNAIPLDVLANGLGMYVAQATGLKGGQKYRIQVEHAADAGSFNTGNYELGAKFSLVAIQPVTFAEGTITADHGINEHVLYVGRTQLFSLALESTNTDSGVLWATIYDENWKPLHLIATPVGETRSATSVLLDPGAYTIQIGAQGGTTLADISYQLVGDRLDEPVGPPIVDPTNTPIYSCPDLLAMFCFPGPVVSPVPILIVPTDPPTVPFPPDATVSQPPDSWFWNISPTATNVTNPVDVTADGFVAPIDALVVINDLNSQGSRLLPPPLTSLLVDVNQDGFVSPLDALMIINVLNATGSGAGGEGEAVNATAVVPPGIPANALHPVAATSDATSGAASGLPMLAISSETSVLPATSASAFAAAIVDEFATNLGTGGVSQLGGRKFLARR